ncbi:hypothetical protein PCE1_002996 [Barthelona sp. PCE]
MNIGGAGKSPRSPISTLEMLKFWRESDLCLDYVQFLKNLAEMCKGRSFFSESKDLYDGNILLLGNWIKKLNSHIEHIPLLERSVNNVRFGNPAFRKIIQKAIQTFRIDFCDILTDNQMNDLCPYILTMFGHHARLDFGTGHELHFFVFLKCLFEISFLNQKNFKDVGWIIMEYFNIVRHIQVYFTLEPAGSMGAWNIDDFNFLPFYFGAAQLDSDDFVDFTPSDCLNQRILRDYVDEKLMFPMAFYFAMSSKTGGIQATAPMLHSVVQHDTWGEIHKGLIRMYKEVVLNNFGAIQHLEFCEHFDLQFNE